MVAVSSSRSSKVPLPLLISGAPPAHIFALIFMSTLGWNLNQCPREYIEPFPPFQIDALFNVKFYVPKT